jgi:prolyl-tRNA editing enzyme YbaK/EbsC (Cys-tRNA(Pro) deacylase)
MNIGVGTKTPRLTHVLVSAGKRGINLRLKVEDLIQVTGAQIIEAL